MLGTAGPDEASVLTISTWRAKSTCKRYCRAVAVLVTAATVAPEELRRLLSRQVAMAGYDRDDLPPRLLTKADSDQGSHGRHLATEPRDFIRLSLQRLGLLLQGTSLSCDWRHLLVYYLLWH